MRRPPAVHKPRCSHYSTLSLLATVASSLHKPAPISSLPVLSPQEVSWIQTRADLNQRPAFAPSISTAKHFSCVCLSRGGDISAASTTWLPLISDGYRKLLIKIFRVPCSCIGNQFTFQFKGFLISQLLRAFLATYPECSSVAASSLMGLATGSWSHDCSPPGRQMESSGGPGPVKD